MIGKQYKIKFIIILLILIVNKVNINFYVEEILNQK